MCKESGKNEDHLFLHCKVAAFLCDSLLKEAGLLGPLLNSTNGEEWSLNWLSWTNWEKWVWIGSPRRETEGIKKWNQVFDGPILASKCMNSYFESFPVDKEVLASPLICSKSDHSGFWCLDTIYGPSSKENTINI